MSVINTSAKLNQGIGFAFAKPIVVLSKYCLKVIDTMDINLLQQALSISKNTQSEYEPVQGLAAIDALTRVYNRQFFESLLHSNWQTAITDKTKLAFFLIDIDEFRKFNQACDLQSANYALLKIAKTLKLLFRRSSDFICRYDGDQFAILATRMDEAQAANYAHAISDRVRKLKIQNSASSLGYLTISIGYVLHQPQINEVQLTLVDQAKQRLQHAKERGRNCSVGNEVERLELCFSP
ncbi:MAG TPA: GGDEF domain-containing protein [Methylophilaceae bacterium]